MRRLIKVGVIVAALLLPVLLPLLFTPYTAYALSITWDGGCGADTSWSCAANWSGDVVPDAGDIAVFNGTSTNDSTVDVNFAGAVEKVDIQAGYTGTVTMARSLTMVDFYQDDGTFTAGSQTMNVGNFNTLGGGVFNAPSGTMNISESLSIAGPSTFNANGGTVNFNGTASASITCNSATFHLVTFTHTSGSKSVDTSCDLPLGNNPHATGGGSIILKGTLTGSGSLTAGGTLALPAADAPDSRNGTAATGFGSGGGGAGWWGGYGGDGLYGGGGGGAAGYFTSDRIGGSGGSGAVVVSPSGAPASLLTAGSSWIVPTGVTSVKIWAIGGGGGGGGASLYDTTSGGGGGAGGVAYKTFSVTPGQTVIYSVGGGGRGGVDAADGSDGGDTTVTVGATTMVGNGGDGGTFDTGLTAAGGGFSGGGGASGGTGSGASGDTGGGGGGGIGGADGVDQGEAGGDGGAANNVAGLFAVVSGLGYPTTGPGTGAGASSGDTSVTGGSLSGFSGLIANNLTLGNDYDFGAYAPFTVGGDFIVNTGGGFTAPVGTASFGGDFSLSYGATFDANGGKVDFNGGSGALYCGNKAFNKVAFSHAAGTKMVNGNCSLPLGSNPQADSGGSIILSGTLSGSGKLAASGTLQLGNGSGLPGFSGLTARALTVSGAYNFGAYSPFVVSSGFTLTSGGSFTAPAGTASFGGDFTHKGGSFTANHGTAVLNGRGQAISGSTSFYNLTKSAAPADSLTFAAGSTTTVGGALTLRGAGTGYLGLFSSTFGSPWYINAGGLTDVYGVNVSDSHSVGTTIVTCGSIDGGNNIGWVFNPDSCGTVGAGSGGTLPAARNDTTPGQSGHGFAPPRSSAGSVPSPMPRPNGQSLVKTAIIAAIVIGLATISWLGFRRRLR